MLKKGRLIKSLGALGKMIAIIPDTTELISKGMDNTRPIVEKFIDQRQERHKHLRSVDNVINLAVIEAKEHLEKQGFVVATIPARADKKYVTSTLNEVVAMSPRGGKRNVGSLIKLYYINLDVLEKSQKLLEEHNLKAVERNQKISDSLENLKHIKIPFGKK
ncbi:PASTA domain-containing protein [Streptococcus catagoni]|uniref:PASTA domain-containing protein n=1 Tax=Streptococcus catagoni TaxID=2654874 RepID=UPI001409CD84|nr:PASTA domain-containing protein [Streptococcus catagoni]